jgi:CRP-like cAMP-binding protein
MADVHCRMTAGATPKANALLAALPESVYRRLLPDLEATRLRQGDTLLAPGKTMKYAYFPTGSIVALLHEADAVGTPPKAWPVGREGVLGISVFLGTPPFVTHADIEIGGDAYRLPARALLAEFRRGGAFQQLLLRYVFALIMQSLQLGICGQSHTIEQRLCGFLLFAFDRVGDELGITQERMAQLLGTRRVSITKAAMQLQQDDLIEYVRGRVTLVNRKKLEERTCACTAIIRRTFEAALE